MTTVPQSVPTLASGAHNPGDGQACVMEYVSMLAGEKWSDSPSCTHPVLAAAARRVNDRLPDSERHLLVPLIGRLFGTAPTGTEHERKVLSVQLAVWVARYAVLSVSPAARASAIRAIEAAEGWTRGEVTTEECRAAASAASAAASADASADAFADAFAAASSAAAASAASAAASAAFADASAAAASAASSSAAGKAPTLVGYLTGLLDEYDRLTGRTPEATRNVTDDELLALAGMVGG